MNIELKLNPAYEPLLSYDNRIEVVYGGAGSGKSYAAAQLHLLAMLQDPERLILVLRKVGATIKFSVWPLLLDVINSSGMGALFRQFRGTHVLECINGARLMTTGLDDVEKLKSIHGITDVWVEEATELTENDLYQINLRLRGKSPVSKRIMLTFNPIHHLHWLKHSFFDVPREEARVTHTTYHDNRFIDEEYKAELERLKEMDAYFYDVYALGKWGVLGNLVFTNFVIEDFDYTAEHLEGASVGIDFGYNHPSAVVRSGFRDGELYVTDEFYQSGLTNSDLLGHVRQFLLPRERAIGDSAEPARIEEMRRAGLSIHGAKKENNSVRDSIDFLKRFRMHIHRTRCPNLAREIQQYKWREDKYGNILDAPVDFNDDAIAALRYSIEPHRINSAPRVRKL